MIPLRAHPAAAWIHWNDGVTLFSSVTRTPFGPILVSSDEAFVANLTGDGLPDLDHRDDIRGQIEVQRNTEGRQFEDGPVIPLREKTGHVQAADVDRDGDVDLITLSSNTSAGDAGGITVIRQGSAGAFATAQLLEVQVAEASALSVADLDADGFPDVVAGYRPLAGTDGRVAIFRSRGEGTAMLAEPEVHSLSVKPTAVLVVDWNVDGLADLLASFGRPGKLAIILGKGQRQLAEVEVAALDESFTSFEVPLVDAADVDGDRDPDLLGLSADVSVLIRNEGGLPGRPEVIRLVGPFANLLLADVIGDGARE